MVADDYGIGLVAVSNFQIIGNTIVPAERRGHCLDGYQPGANNGVIQNNYVNVENSRTGRSGHDAIARALRMRNDVDARARRLTSTSAATRSSPRTARVSDDALSVWISYINNTGAMNNANVNLDNNTIEAIATPPIRRIDAYRVGSGPGRCRDQHDDLQQRPGEQRHLPAHRGLQRREHQ